jgi:hypothetical protein
MKNRTNNALHVLVSIKANKPSRTRIPQTGTYVSGKRYIRLSQIAKLSPVVSMQLTC